jgi:hypothetical protein
MNLERTLGKAIEFKFKTRTELHEDAEDFFERVVLGFGYLVAPLAKPIERVMDKIYNWTYKQ